MERTHRANRSLAAALTGSSGPRWRQAVVVSVQSGEKITVTIAGQEVAGVRYMSHLPPLVGAPVWLVINGRDTFAVGLIGVTAPIARITRGAAQTLGTGGGARAAITFDDPGSGAGRDPYDLWDSGNAGRLTVPFDGIWTFWGSMQWASSGSGTFRRAEIEVDATTVRARDHRPVAAGLTYTLTCQTPPLSLTAGQYVRLVAEHDAGSSQDVQGANDHSPWLSARYEGPL